MGCSETSHCHIKQICRGRQLYTDPYQDDLLCLLEDEYLVDLSAYLGPDLARRLSGLLLSDVDSSEDNVRTVE